MCMLEIIFLPNNAQNKTELVQLNLIKVHAFLREGPIEYLR